LRRIESPPCFHDSHIRNGCVYARHSYHSVLPPHILEQIAINGTEPQRELAVRTLSTDHSFRNLRAIRLAAPVAHSWPTRAHGPAETVTPGMPRRTIYHAGSMALVSGRAIRCEGDAATDDAAINEAYDALGYAYNFYWEMLQRDSIDGNGAPLEAFVHYDEGMNNAFWDGHEMIFGDGDGELFNRFTVCLDVIGHELAHGVTEHEAQLINQGQSGALNESLSDVFGSLVRQHANHRQPAVDADWLIGEGLFTGKIAGKALRSLKAPGTAYNDEVIGKDPQPDHMDRYVHTTRDNGGVHINSGIPNKAFYLTALGLGGFAGEKAGRIWYEALRDRRLRPDATFAEFADLTCDTATRLYGGNRECRIAREAWESVGVVLPSTTCTVVANTGRLLTVAGAHFNG